MQDTWQKTLGSLKRARVKKDEKCEGTRPSRLQEGDAGEHVMHSQGEKGEAGKGMLKLVLRAK